MIEKKRFNWRRYNYLLHRDIGFLCVGLSLIYAISGVAVNHIADWNPSYSSQRTETNIGPVTGDPKAAATISHILTKLNDPGKLENSYRPAPEMLQLFVEGRSILVHLPSGHTVYDRAVPRPILREMNFLHLNHPKKAWTWVADIYAAALAFLALSGLFMIRRKTLKRGLVLTGVGVVVPVVFLVWYL
ncbi:MAG: PepSY-associated TM helix domain-containing protein [Desulfuromonadales bacterium]|nr:PepSY-associated TM helix domain-containing protein [Desulfuromonadales bacterium]